MGVSVGYPLTVIGGGFVGFGVLVSGSKELEVGMLNSTDVEADSLIAPLVDLVGAARNH